MSIIRKFDSYYFGSEYSLTKQHLCQLAAIFNNPSDASVSVLGGRKAVCVTRLEGIGPVIVKSYWRGGIISNVIKRRYLKIGKKRSQSEYEALRKFRDMGGNAPEPIAFAYSRGLFYRAWLIIREIEGAETLAALSRKDEKRAEAVMKGLVEQLVKLVEQGVLHSDFHPGNVLIDYSDKCFVIDFDKTSFSQRNKRKLWKCYRSRWQRALNKYNLPRIIDSFLWQEAQRGEKNPSILIILMGALGDVARGLSLASLIKKKRPESKITWLVEPKCADLVRLHPMIDRVIVFERPKGVRAVCGLFRELSREDFDLTLDLQRHLKSGFFSFLSRASRRVCFNRKDGKEFNWLFNNDEIPDYDDTLPKWRHYLKFAVHLGLPEPDSPDFGFSTIDFRSYLPGNIEKAGSSYIAVVMGSTWESKDWNYQGYLRLVDNIIASGRIGVAMVGAGSQKSWADKISKQVDSERLVNLVGETNLTQLVAVLNAALVAVGPDSGPGHLASTVGTPYVSLFGPTSPERTAPYGSEHLVVQCKVDCAPCYKRKCPGLGGICMHSVTPEMIEEKIWEAIEARDR